MSSNSTPYKRALLHVSLDSFSSFNEYYQEIVSLAICRVSESLTIYVSSPDIHTYKDVPFVHWTEVHDVLSLIYVTATKAAYDNFRLLLNVDVVFEEWCGYSLELSDDEQFEVIFGEREDSSNLRKFNENRKNSNLLELPIQILPSKLKKGQNISITHNDSSPGSSPRPSITKTTRFDHVAVGGTFDHLHAGHKILLHMSAWITSKRLVCGVTAENMLQNKKYKEFLEPIDTRVSKVLKFLRKIRSEEFIKYQVVPIFDIYGPTATDSDIEALVVSKETMAGANSINEERKKRSLKQLDFAMIEVISSTNSSLNEAELKSLKLSSTSVREHLYKTNTKASNTF
ncbi:1509_t:CDS:2 [Ambispora gerdemannii]|uniref:1509_t:CDS:1 n=1 Tax=Ambispora gerdemannii TaxID=144530 RepID=A0A9N9G348_9GLOM|nr:1509_t:CDS:2 [Ambispora gerdemannii]